jgi:isocitrate dehydrogenase
MHSKIIWTKIDEAPALASYALLPIVQAYCKACDIEIDTMDISFAGRIIANFPDNLTEEQRQSDDLAQLGELVKQENANIIKLPNISASIPQLQAAIKELQELGYNIPDYPHEANTDEEKKLIARFARVLGSAVNPVLREGNSDRRAAKSVKKFAKKHPHRGMKPWTKGNKTDVACMACGDFYGSEKAVTVPDEDSISIVFEAADGSLIKTLKSSFALKAGEIIDSAVMNVHKLEEFYAEQIENAKSQNLLLSLHLKATMMKVSDPIMFGHCVRVYYKDVLDKHAGTLAPLGINLNNGLDDLLAKITSLDKAKQTEILADINALYKTSAPLAMVNSDKGITNLSVPNNVIVDASMPVVIRDGGKMWNAAGELAETLALIPDRSYALIYKAIIDDCKANGQFDPATMGSVSNVGLMAQKAEEYGSHDKTFEAEGAGVIRVVNSAGEIIMEQRVQAGDIFRMCQTKDAPIRNWVELAVARAKATGNPAIFWLDANRAHDREVIAKVNEYLPLCNTEGLDIRIMEPVEAMKFSTARCRAGLDTISVTGNVLRDYLTDLFPILELGTSARMLSIVPLMNGGGLYETGAGGSAPKLAAQLHEENHLRWDSLGEYCALVPSFEQVAAKADNPKAKVLADTLNIAITEYLENAKSPSRVAGERDNRGSNFFLSMYWARALADQDVNAELKAKFRPVAEALEANQEKIELEMLEVQGRHVELGGYYKPLDELAIAIMRPSETFNSIIDGI